MFEAVSDSIDKMGLQLEKLCELQQLLKTLKGFMLSYCELYISVSAGE